MFWGNRDYRIVSDSNNVFYDINHKILTKKVISKISEDSNFTFTSYVWLGALALFHRLLFQTKTF